MQEKRICRLCNRNEANSNEHVPPQSTGNTSLVEIKYINGQLQGISHLSRSSQNGFWVPVLCKSCNQKLGTRYVTEYANFITQITQASGILEPQDRMFVPLKNIYPLRILKHLFSMFLCTLPQHPIPHWKTIQDFVRKRDEQLPKDAPIVYLYKNIANIGRIVPWCSIIEILTPRPVIALSEISWPPLGVIFCSQEDERFAHMENVNSWGQYRFKDKLDLLLSLPPLRVNTDHPLAFGSSEEIKRWRDQSGVIWAVAENENPVSEINVAMTWRRTEA